MKRRLLSILLAGAMTIGLLAGCGSTAGGNNAPAGTGTGEGTEAAGSSASSDTPLVVGYSHFSSKFSPFFKESEYDDEAQIITQVYLLEFDRQGAAVYKGIEGETRNYNGTDYTYKGISDLTVTENPDGTVYYDF
ncbi:MAG: ABC transporter substrate-binding protein, partial [Lachnospiraceae bacterium]|nr:ABC transporter substrate-binding protein [Lachnospiraceae bacterium]